MSIGAFTLYSSALLAIGNGGFNLSVDSYAMILLSNAYTPLPNSDSTYANVSPYELPTGSGYTAGGQVLVGNSYTTIGGLATFTLAGPTWSAFAGVFRYAAIVRQSSSSLIPTDKLLCYCDCTNGGVITGAGGPLTITMSPSGIFTVAHSP